jgi:peptidoglycan/xylan/chitin deacetylase (PgdA/CDA1 family)
MYHRVAREGSPALKRYRVAPAAFAEQIRFLRENGYYAITLEEWDEASAGRRPLRGRPVLITFDDGYRDFLTDAWPALRACSFTATVFLPAAYIGKTADWDKAFGDPPPLLAPEEIRALREEGVSFGSHGLSHLPLAGLSPEKIVEEAARSRIAIREIVGEPVSSIAYPHGDQDPIVRHLIGACGYTFGLTCERRSARYSDPLLALPRIEVDGSFTLEEFARLLLLERKDLVR